MTWPRTAAAIDGRERLQRRRDRRRGGRGTRRSARRPQRPGAGIAWTIIASSGGLRDVIPKHDADRPRPRRVPPPPDPPDGRAAGGDRHGQRRRLHARGASDEVTVEPRIVEARLGRVSLEQVDVSLRVALRASQAATIRSIAFTDAFVGQVPVWIERVEGDWPLEPRPRAGDSAAGAGPHPRAGRGRGRRSRGHRPQGRGHGPGQRRSGHRDAVAGAPHVHGPDADAGPRRRARAADSDRRGRISDRWRASAPTSPTRRSAAPRRGWRPASIACPARSAMVLRYGGAVAAVTTRYAIEGGGSPDARERRAAGVWWSPAVFCTTREAIEPWRFDVADATALQLGGGAPAPRPWRRPHRRDAPTVPALDIDLAAARPDAAGARGAQALHAASMAGPAACGSPIATPRRTWCVCRSWTASGRRPPPRRRRRAPTRPPRRRAGARRRRRGVLARADRSASSGRPSRRPRDDRLRIATPLYRLSFGSPLVSGDRMVGLVASPTTAWPAALVATAASRAPRASTAPASASEALGAGRLLALR